MRDAPIIGNNVWVATNSVVVGGITIGNKVTVGAGAIVTTDVPDNVTIIGNPLKVIKINNQMIQPVFLKDLQQKNEGFI